METLVNSKTKLVSVEIYREPIFKIIQIDKNINVNNELVNNPDFREFFIEHFYDEIHDYGFVVKSDPSYSPYKPEEFLYKTDSGGFGFGEVVPHETKSFIGYYPMCQGTNGGKTLKETVELFLSTSKEETKKLWDKGEIQKLCENLIKYNKLDDPVVSGIPEDESVIFHVIYEERHNPVDIYLQDVESFQKIGGRKGDLLSKGSPSME